MTKQQQYEPTASDMPLLLPKLQPPRLSSSLVEREHLLNLLDGAYSHPLTLLSAPAGFGKTTLVGQWIASRSMHKPRLPTSWISLAQDDNDPLRFWRYVITACQCFHNSVSDSVLAQLCGGFRLSFELHFLERVLTSFLNDMALHDCRGLLVLEDYHAITEPTIHETLAFFLDHLPSSLHVVMLSRSEPALPLARWRASGAVQEIQTNDLRFSPEETATFFRRTFAYTLSKPTIHKLDAQLEALEGWAAGLRLLSLTLQGRTAPADIEQHLVLLANNHRPILDYFITEVLSAQEEPLQRFLLQTSVLSRLNGSLCDAMTGRQDSGLLLEKVERAGLFLQSLNGPGQWYRYHEMFAEALRHEALRRLGEEALRALLLRACRWYETHDLLDEAVETALSIHAYAHAASLIERYTVANPIAGRHHTLHRWLSQLPDEILWPNPTLCFMYAMAHLFSKDHYAPAARVFMETLFQKAEQGWRAVNDQPKLGMVYTLRSLIAWWQDDYATSFAVARQALTLLSTQDVMWRGMSLAHIGMEEQFMGRFNAARLTTAEARSLCVGNIYATLAATLRLGNLCYEQGALQQAEQYYRQVLRETEKNEHTHDDQGFALIGLAHLAYECNDLVSARQQASQALASGKQLDNASLQVFSALALSRILHAQGEDEQARQLLQELVPQVQKPALLRELLLAQARLALACGDLATALRWTPATARQGTPIPFVQREQEMLFQARLLSAQGVYQQALALLAGWQREEFSRGELESLVLSALVHTQLATTEQSAEKQASHRSLAQQSLMRALELARPEAFQRLFLDEGEKMGALLRTVLPEIRDVALHRYASHLALAFSEPVALPNSLVPASNPLSVQEQRVLHLLATGRTKPAMAQELIVSLNTIKTHVKSIYRKLGATSRQEALARAHALHLL